MVQEIINFTINDKFVDEIKHSKYVKNAKNKKRILQILGFRYERGFAIIDKENDIMGFGIYSRIDAIYSSNVRIHIECDKKYRQYLLTLVEKWIIENIDDERYLVLETKTCSDDYSNFFQLNGYEIFLESNSTNEKWMQKNVGYSRDKWVHLSFCGVPLACQDLHRVAAGMGRLNVHFTA